MNEELEQQITELVNDLKKDTQTYKDVLTQKVDQLSKLIEQSQKDVDDFKNGFAAKAKEIDGYCSKAISDSETLENAKLTIAKETQFITDSTALLNSLKTKLVDFDNKLSSLDETAKSVSALIPKQDELDKRIVSAESEVEKDKKELADVQNEISAKTVAISAMHSMYQETEESLEALKKELADIRESQFFQLLLLSKNDPNELLDLIVKKVIETVVADKTKSAFKKSLPLRKKTSED